MRVQPVSDRKLTDCGSLSWKIAFAKSAAARLARTSCGKRIHSLFPPALAVNILGHVNIRRDPCCPVQPPALRLRAAYDWNAEAPKIPFIAPLGRVRISAKVVC